MAEAVATVLGFGLFVAPAAAGAQGVPIRVLTSTFACRDLSDAIRLGLRMAENDKPAFEALYLQRQAVGACVPLREGTIALLQDSHDEQGLHLVCIEQPGQPACFWSVSPRFGEMPPQR